MKKFKISTPDADEYKELIISVDNNNYIVSNKHKGLNWNIVRADYTSVWKLYSSKYKDNVYPTIEEIK